MGSTYINLQDRLADEIRPGATAATVGGGVSTAQLKTAILSAVKHYERRKFYFNQKTGTFSTVIDQEDYAAAANADIPDIVEIFDPMKVTVSGSKYDVRKALFTDILSEQTGAVKGQPTNFCYFAQKIRIYPIPDAVYTMTMAYHYRLAALSADADDTVWTNDGEQLIRHRARWDLATNKLRDDKMAARAKAAELDALAAIEAETAKRLRRGILHVDSALVSGGVSNINLG